ASLVLPMHPIKQIGKVRALEIQFTGYFGESITMFTGNNGIVDGCTKEGYTIVQGCLLTDHNGTADKILLQRYLLQRMKQMGFPTPKPSFNYDTLGRRVMRNIRLHLLKQPSEFSFQVRLVTSQYLHDITIRHSGSQSFHGALMSYITIG